MAGNNPKPGSVITVEPIKSRRDIETIKRLLADSPREAALFTVGINTALRASDLLALTAEQVRAILADGDDGGLVRETKTGKRRRLVFNEAARAALTRLLAGKDYETRSRSSRASGCRSREAVDDENKELVRDHGAALDLLHDLLPGQAPGLSLLNHQPGWFTQFLGHSRRAA